MFLWARHRLPGRPQYLWGSLHAARLARALGHERTSVLELGVAGGQGLLDLERAAALAEELVGVGVDVAGFDVGGGMPRPVDERDIPWAIQEGIFPMDEPALRARLRAAELVIGPVSATIPAWFDRRPSPVGFVAVDLDLYSSTMDALVLLDAAPQDLLPRVAFYFDDIFGYGWSDFAGERGAIRDFNATHDRRRLSPFYGLEYELGDADRFLAWPAKMFMAHLLDSPSYNQREWEIPPSWAEAHRLPPEPTA